MSFFDQPPPPPPPPPQRYRQPDWMGPPDHVAPAVVGLELVLANTGAAALVLSNVLVYPTGFVVHLLISLRELPPQGPIRSPMPLGPHVGGAPPDEMLRFGVQFSDGRKAMNTAGRHWAQQQAPEGPVLMPQGGSGGGMRWRLDYWVWPLPPEGELQFACEWPAQRLALKLAGIDAAVVLSAAKRAVELWSPPDLPEMPHHGGPPLPHAS